VHDLLLQKSDGVFELVVWGEQIAGTHDISITLGSSRAAVKIYDTTIGTAPIQILSNASIARLTVGDHAMIAEIE
jgi:hypothetical protein